MRSAALPLLALVALAGCAKSRSPGAEEPAASPAVPAEPAADRGDEAKAPRSTDRAATDLDLPEAGRALTEADRRLGDSLALAAPDCPTSRALRDRICELSARICDLEGSRAPAEAAHCDDGRRRCDAARDRVAERCGAEP